MANNNTPTTNSQFNKTLHKAIHPTNRLIRWPEVHSLVGLGRSHVHQLAAKGLFPKPRKLIPGGRASAWVESEILSWVNQRINQPDSAE